MSRTQDPYYLVREEIQESLSILERNYDRLELLPSGTPEFTRLKADVSEGCESVTWQLEQLQKAIDISEKNPDRFNLDRQELDSRQAWASNARSKVAAMRRGLDAILRKAPATVDPAVVESQRRNDDFIGDQSNIQMQIMRQQDQDLDALGSQVQRIGQIGLTIHDELESQNQLLEEIDEDLDATQNRLAAVQKKVEKVLQRVSARGQMCIIAALIVVLILLVVFTFS